jgi:uncharacterized coiled-coil protein SlyX
MTKLETMCLKCGKQNILVRHEDWECIAYKDKRIAELEDYHSHLQSRAIKAEELGKALVDKVGELEAKLQQSLESCAAMSFKGGLLPINSTSMRMLIDRVVETEQERDRLREALREVRKALSERGFPLTVALIDEALRGEQ